MLYPFLHYAHDHPRKLLVDIHSYCNARCTMCPYPQLSRTQSQGDMDIGLYRAIVDELSELGREHDFVPQMSYCYMGEPFVSDRVHEYVEYAIERGIKVYLNTNASLLSEAKTDALLATGFTGQINISVPGITPEVYERITGLDYAVTMSNIGYLLAQTEAQRVLIRGVDDHWPAGEKERWLEYWEDKGVQIEYLAPISRCGGVGRLLPEQLKEKKTVRLYGCNCHHPLVEMVILFDGRAVMCCQDMGRELIWGNVSEEGLTGVWNSAIRKEAVRKLYSGELVTKKFLCARCEQAMTRSEMMQMLFRKAWRKLARREKKELQPV
jgi:MoaA/NifB/PqqE/SkfB family radical SAM enzyme